VSQEAAFEFANGRHAGYSEVSAKKGDGIEMLFESIIANILVVKEDNGNQSEATVEGSVYPHSSHRLERNSVSREKSSVGKINKETVVKVVDMRKPMRFGCCFI
jgi:translation elongation factor EF-4